MENNLGEALLGLTDSIRSTMANVHSLNIAVLNIGSLSHHVLHCQFVKLRDTLKTHWTDDVTKLLQQIYQVIGDLIFLEKSIEQGSEKECLVFFQETVDSVAAVEISSRTCLARNAEIARNVQVASCHLMSLHPSHPSDVSQRSSESSNISSELSSEGLGFFVHLNLSAAYPNLASSATSTLMALTNTQTHLTAISHFCVALRKACENVLGAYLTKKHRVSEDTRQMYLTSWETHRQDLQTAFQALAPIVDAITIEPSCRGPQQRRSHEISSPTARVSSTFATLPGSTCYPSIVSSTAQSPTTIENNGPFRQSSFSNARFYDSTQSFPGKPSSMQENVDQVPLSCWKGFFFGRSVKKRSDYPTASNHTY